MCYIDYILCGSLLLEVIWQFATGQFGEPPYFNYLVGAAAEAEKCRCEIYCGLASDTANGVAAILGAAGTGARL